MIDLGRFSLGDFVPLMLLSVDGNGLNAWPSSTPTIKTFSQDDLTTAVETIRPGARDPLRATGLFYYPLRLTSSYTADKVYLVSQRWTISASTYGELLTFRVVAGGDADGAVIGAHFVRRPEANTLVYVVDGGKLKTGRSPR